MPNYSVLKTGDWEKAGILINRLSTKLNSYIKKRMKEKANMVLDQIRGHLENQDLDWIPLAERTVAMKENDLTLVETGFLKEHLSVIEQPDGQLFVGASPDVVHPSGLALSDLMIYQEYGTLTIPPRPLIRPTYEEVKSKIGSEFAAYMKDFVEGDE